MFSLLVTVLLATRPRPVGGGATSLYDFTLDDIDGKPVSLAQFKGKALLIVNVASRCGFTYQYAGLEALYRKYRDRGFVVLGFPANNFFGQEPGTDAEIRQFCSATYAVSFPMFSKISVRGRDMHPLYRWLTSRRTNPGFAGAITWNFNKFLVGRDGRVVARLRTRDEPESDAVSSAVEAALR